MPLQVRRGTTADRTSITPLIGEIIYDTTEKILYVGDGVTPGGVGATSLTVEEAQDAAAGLFTSGLHSNISFSYNDLLDRIDATVNLSSYNGTISASEFRGDLLGSVFSDDSTMLVDSTLGSFQLDGTVRTNIVPFTSEIYDLGSPTNKFKDLYLSGSSLYLGDAQITATGTAINLPAGSTIGGNSIASSVGDGLFEGDIKGSVFGEDSTILVDATSNLIRGNFAGSLGANLNTNGFALTSNNDVFIVPLNFTQFGSINSSLNGNIVIRRTSYTGGILDGKGGFLFEQYHNNILADRMTFHRSRGTYTAPLALQSGDRIAEISFVGNTNVAPFSQISASIRVVATGGPNGNVIPSRIEFRAVGGPIESDSRVAVMTQDKKLLVNSIEGLSTGLSIVGDITGSVFSDSSSRIIDGTDGSITAGSFVQFGSLTAAERNALSAVNGMVIYNTTYNRFEGFQNGAWINLDDGTAAGA